MKLLRNTSVISMLLFGVVCFGIAAQSSPTDQEVTATAVGQGHATYEFIDSEISFPDKVVKGAPYSAKAVTKTTQAFADGNRIVRQTTASVYRDSEGRTRREQMLPTIGPWAPENDDIQLITIHDPVEKLTFMLNPKEGTAKKRGNAGVFVISTVGEGKGRNFTIHSNIHTSDKDAEKKVQIYTSSAEVVSEGKGHDNVVFHAAPVHEDHETGVTESLGTRQIEGLTAEGTRTTRTIPAGEIGNEMPIVIVTEKWYSPELEVVLLRSHNDPRFGETIYSLTNISRDEPDPELFLVPDSYTIGEGKSYIRIKKKDESN